MPQAGECGFDTFLSLQALLFSWYLLKAAHCGVGRSGEARTDEIGGSRNRTAWVSNSCPKQSEKMICWLLEVAILTG